MSPVGWWSRNAWSSRSDLSRCRGTYHKFVKKKIFKKFWTCRAQRRGPQSSWDRWRTAPRMFRRCRVSHRGRQILAPGPLCTGPWQWQAVTHGDTQWHTVTHSDTQWHTVVTPRTCCWVSWVWSIRPWAPPPRPGSARAPAWRRPWSGTGSGSGRWDWSRSRENIFKCS